MEAAELNDRLIAFGEVSEKSCFSLEQIIRIFDAMRLLEPITPPHVRWYRRLWWQLLGIC
jgi:hypothetical protein